MKIFETERLLLRSIREDDAEQAFNSWCSDEEVCKYLPWSPHKNVEETKSFFKMFEEKNKEENNHEKVWAIVYKPDNKIIGTISCVSYEDKYAKRAELGYCIAREYWGKGITTESLKLIVPYYLFDLNTYRVQAIYDVLNPASGKVMEKAGLKFEGVLKGYRGTATANICDVAICGITQDEYNNNN